MTIRKRVLVAKIEERKKAREQYETAKKEGKNASLLEQQRPNLFQMNVANILPTDVFCDWGERASLELSEAVVKLEKCFNGRLYCK